MKIFRVFFKDTGDSHTDKSKAIIEIEKKKISDVVNTANKMAKKKGMRVVMVAEIGGKTDGVKDKL